MMKLKQIVAAVAAVAAFGAHAGVVKVWGESYPLSTLNSFYNSLAGHSSSIATGTLDTVNLTGVNLLWAVQPADAYTSAELNTMSSFLAGGGRIAFMGEHGSFMPAQNNRINTALTSLGASIQIVNTMVDPGFRTASVADGQIKAHSLTTGVTSYQYAAFAPLTVSGTAQVLMTGETDTNAVMMAYQNIGAGSIFLITDQNVWDNASSNWGNGSFSNGRMFENLLSGNTNNPNNPVPEPYGLALVGVALLGAGVARRRKAA